MTPWVLDLDGVIWVGERAVPGAADAVAALQPRHPVWFCTNNSSGTIADYAERLASHGIDSMGRIVSSATAAGSTLSTGQRVLCCAGPGVTEAVQCAGSVVIDPRTSSASAWAEVDVVIIGFHRDVMYRTLQAATRAVLGGARFLATNDDPIYPDTDGPSPGCGALVAAVERASGHRAEIMGKPHAPMAHLMRQRCEAGGFSVATGVMVGDSPATDGELARRLGWPFGLVLTGNTDADAVPTDHPADWVAHDLAELVCRHA